MDLNERFNVLAQGVMVAQKNGVLSLDEAVEAKKNIETIQKGENLKESLGALANICNEMQKKGIYTLQDAHFLFMAIDGLDEEITKFTSQSQPQGEGNPTEAPQAEVTEGGPAQEQPVAEPTEKKSKKKGK